MVSIVDERKDCCHRIENDDIDCVLIEHRMILSALATRTAPKSDLTDHPDMIPRSNIMRE